MQLATKTSLVDIETECDNLELPFVQKHVQQFQKSEIKKNRNIHKATKLLIVKKYKAYPCMKKLHLSGYSLDDANTYNPYSTSTFVVPKLLKDLMIQLFVLEQLDILICETF